MFTEHITECQSLAAQASEELKKVRAAPEQERSAISAAAFSFLKQADKNLQSLQFEARSAPAAERSKLNQEADKLRMELRAIAKDLEQARKDLLLGANSGGNTDRLFLSNDERKRSAIAVTESLHKGRAQLKEANRTALETERIGIDSLQELRKQKETLMRMKQNTTDLGSNLDGAQKAVKELEKPNCTTM
mmetsp:Transcript_43321/g.122568  ORF Transcript_43321/g.122568 Transcript_43321/m.122568 type:complete len:191 (-) Transcript_43321:66-638(-)